MFERAAVLEGVLAFFALLLLHALTTYIFIEHYQGLSNNNSEDGASILGAGAAYGLSQHGCTPIISSR